MRFARRALAPVVFALIGAPLHAAGPIDNPIPGPVPAGAIPVHLVPVATGLMAPNWGTFAPVPASGVPSAADRLFVTDQNGILWAIDLASGDKVVFLDVTAQLVNLGVAGPGSFDERGFLGVAFHPDYAQNGLLYTYTSEPAAGPADFTTLPPGTPPNHQAVITEWKVTNPTAVPDPLDPTTLVDPASERELLRVDEPQFNHDGGCVNFGPDGRLYISLGDGGAGDDQGTGHVPGGNGQDPGNILGTILRIDPTGTNSANGKYGIPADNPFVNDPTALDEIFAYGFRNPFRFSFDVGTALHPGTGALLVGDVGQNDIEEIDVVIAGGNYGWPFKEGSFFFDQNGASSGFVTDMPVGTPPPGLIDPIAEYDHDEGIAIIGGFVYRGTAIPALSGLYVFAEFGTTFNNDGRLFHLDAQAAIREFPLIGQTKVGKFVLGMGQDRAGELYLLINSTGTPFPGGSGAPTGEIWRIAPAAGYIDLGKGKAGSAGVVPRLAGDGPLVPGSANAVALSRAHPSALVAIVAGTQNVSAPLLGGTLVPSPDVLAASVTDANGNLIVPFVWPQVGAPSGSTVFTQFWVEDAGATFGIAASNGLQVTSP